jgi:hypothetical protein
MRQQWIGPWWSQRLQAHCLEPLTYVAAYPHDSKPLRIKQTIIHQQWQSSSCRNDTT